MRKKYYKLMVDSETKGTFQYGGPHRLYDEASANKEIKTATDDKDYQKIIKPKKFRLVHEKVNRRRNIFG